MKTISKLPVITLKGNYENYLNGEEVMTTIKSHDYIFEGDHVMVYKDSISVNTSITVPREKQSEYIGVEGVVTKLIDRVFEDSADEKEQIISVKIL
jgi:hypothetical protein